MMLVRRTHASGPAAILCCSLVSGARLGPLSSTWTDSFTPLGGGDHFSEVAMGATQPCLPFSALQGPRRCHRELPGSFRGSGGHHRLRGSPCSDNTPTGPLTLDPAAPTPSLPRGATHVADPERQRRCSMGRFPSVQQAGGRCRSQGRLLQTPSRPWQSRPMRKTGTVLGRVTNSS